MRIDQYGFTPERLWAATFILVALLFGLAYWAALARRLAGWPEGVRTSNAWLALALCGLAVLLATPIINFGAISTRDQLARLNSGKITPDKFDWRALAFDFGPSGRKALEQLKRSGGSATIRTAAVEALAYQSRWDAPAPEQRAKREEAIAKARILPRAIPLPPPLAEAIGKNYRCQNGPPCTVLYQDGADYAVVISQPTCTGGPPSQGRRECDVMTTTFYRRDNQWVEELNQVAQSRDAVGDAALRLEQAWQQGAIEVRTVTRRQVFIGGEPVGAAFE
jgi:uncharacterized protein DUF4153